MQQGFGLGTVAPIRSNGNHYWVEGPLQLIHVTHPLEDVSISGSWEHRGQGFHYSHVLEAGSIHVCLESAYIIV